MKLSDCPHKPGTVEWRRWQQAFLDCQPHDDELSASGRALVKATMAESEAQRHARELEAEVDPTIRPPVSYLSGDLISSWITVTADALTRLAAAMAVTVEALRPWFDELADKVGMRAATTITDHVALSIPLAVAAGRADLRVLASSSGVMTAIYVDVNAGTITMKPATRLSDDWSARQPPRTPARAVRRARRAANPARPVCPAHGEPRGSCRRCWR